jgi:hypothetical protein
MNHAQTQDAPHGRRRGDEPKIRDCLRCNAKFPSAWSGERICNRCKSTAAWRQGVPASSGAARRRR